MTSKECRICGKHKRLLSTSWCLECTEQFEALPRVLAHYDEPTPEAPEDDPKTLLRENLP